MTHICRRKPQVSVETISINIKDANHCRGHETLTPRTKSRSYLKENHRQTSASHRGEHCESTSARHSWILDENSRIETIGFQTPISPETWKHGTLSLFVDSSNASEANTPSMSDPILHDKIVYYDCL